MKIRFSNHSKNIFSLDIISILLIIIFLFNICWLKINYYYESQTIWNSLYRYLQRGLFIYLLSLILFAIIKWRKKCSVGILATVILLVIYELIVSAYYYIFNWPIIMEITIWPMCFLVGLIYCDKSIISNANKIIIDIMIVVYGILSIPSIMSHINGRGNIGGVIFPVYILLAMACFLLIQKDSIMKTVLIIFIGIIILCTTKRAGLMCFVGGIMAYYCGDIYLKRKSIKIYFKAIFGSILLINIGLWIIEQFDLNIIERFMSLESDGGSGRSEIWRQVYDSFLNSDIFSRFFGHGFHAVSFDLNIQGRGILAHNDYYEYLYDFGLIGVGLIVCFIIYIFINFISYMKKHSNLAPALAYALVCFIFLSTFSYLMEESKLINLFALFLGMTFNKDWK